MFFFFLLIGVIVLRIIWQIKPGTKTAIAFWGWVGVWALLHIVTATGISQVGWSLASIGILSNALVTIANGGSMPVFGRIESSISFWKPARKEHHFLCLADKYMGFSIGDGIIFIGISLALVDVFLL